MDERSFDRLCAACDDLLTEGGLVLARVSTPWLHVLNEHPSNQAQYLVPYPGLGAAIGKFVARLFGVRLRRALTGGAKPWVASRSLPSRCDVLVFSHFLSAAQAGEPVDFYFGELPAALQAAGKSVAIVMRNHSSTPASAVVSKWPNDAPPRIFLSGHLGLAGEIRIALEQLRQGLCLAWRPGERGLASIPWRAAKHLLSGATADNLAFFRQTQALVRATRPSAIVVTYEGHAWERLAFAAARSIDPLIRCIGYHHAILFPRQHAISRPLSARFDPDMVLFAGEVARERFRRRSSLQARLEVVGTSRNDAPIPHLEPKLANCAAVPSCLVLPDGTQAECLLMIGFAIACARELPGLRFLIRLHPVMSFDRLAAVEPSLAKLPANVFLSKQAIESDFNECRWALYRGSGSGVRAAGVGLRPLYQLPRGETMSMDPLAELTSWRKVVSSTDDFRSVVESDLHADPTTLGNEFASVRHYLQSYFMPMDTRKFVALVSGEPWPA